MRRRFPAAWSLKDQAAQRGSRQHFCLCSRSCQTTDDVLKDEVEGTSRFFLVHLTISSKSARQEPS